MHIHVRLHGMLDTPGRGSLAVEAEPGAMVLQILQALGLDGETYSILAVNGELVSAQAVLRGGDVLDVYPPLAGGGGPPQGSLANDV